MTLVPDKRLTSSDQFATLCFTRDQIPSPSYRPDTPVSS